MNQNVNIKPMKVVYPQIYAYKLPKFEENEGWIKIGYTKRKDVNVRIKEQVKTAAINLDYIKLWSMPAKFQNSSNKWFKDKDFHKFLTKFKHVEQRPDTEWFYYNGNPEKSLEDFKDFINSKYNQVNEEIEEIDYKLRVEQEQAVIKTLEYAKNHKNGEFLWNAKPRFGKTLTTYDLARHLKAKKVLIVTNRPAISNSWYDDFEKFIAWQTNFAFISTSDSLKNRPVLTREEFNDQMTNGKEDMFTFISLQDLKGSLYFGGNHDKLKWVKELKWDLLVIDEAHEGIDTFKTDIAFENINRNFTLHLSGTPFKAIASGKFSENQIYNWTYADEQEAKNNWDYSKEENNPYDKLPRLNLFSYQMSQMITNEVNKGIEINGRDIDYAFDLNEFFKTTTANNNKNSFIHENDVKKWLDSLSQNEKYPFSTEELRNKLKHTFWLLNRVDSAKALEKLLKKHPVFKDYEIIIAAGDGQSNDDDDKKYISKKSIDKVKKAIASNDKTITLSVGQLTTGVTIPEWTGVLMLSNIKSPSLYMQAAFRAQNPWKYVIDEQVYQKENAYVFDFAPERTLIIYDEFANNLLSENINIENNDKRKENINNLLNFFPVIAEDDKGKMIELNVEQVLTIPKAIKAQEVVNRGFMSNFLFQNISGIFSSREVLDILEQLNSVNQGKINPKQTRNSIDIMDIKIDEEGNPIVENEVVIAQSNAYFGEKVYGNINASIEETIDNDNDNLPNIIKDIIKENSEDSFKNLAKEHGLNDKYVDKIISENANIIGKEVERVQELSKIKKSEAKIEYEKIIDEFKDEPIKLAEANVDYEIKKKQIEDEEKKYINETLETKTKELFQESTETILQKVEEKKKNVVEDDVRARLRGFARTIPSFLMAYGNSETTLENFDENIKDNVFKEVTGITLEQFRVLRDEFKFFAPEVFNTSVQEFLKKHLELANYFDETQNEDIFNYIPSQKTNQIFTPKWIVKKMVDILEEENPNIFQNPNATFVDLYVKSGLYLTEIVKRLYKGLENVIPNKDERLKHILENQIYGFAPTEIIYNIAKNFIFGFDERAKNINDSHIIHLNTLEYAKDENGHEKFKEKCNELFGGKMKFDVVIGNPPYQTESIGESTSYNPIYNYFYDLAEKVGSKYCIISPARFLFNAGATPKDWNKKMLSDKHLIPKWYETNSSEVFENTDIKGGVVILYRNEAKDFGKIGVFTSFEELNSIINKVKVLNNETLDTIISSRGVYKFNSKIYSNSQINNILSKNNANIIGTNAFEILNDIIFLKNKPIDNNEYIKFLGRYNGNREYHWIRKDYVNEPFGYDKYRVILPKANGSGALGEALSIPLVVEPLTGFTETFISVGAFDTELEANNALKYIKTKFARVMLSILRITQHNSKNKWKYVPLQDFTSNSDIDWTKSISEIDKQLYKKYNLDQNEINFIEEKVKAMK